MDKCVKDNKNRYSLAFMLLTMKKMFEEVKMGSLVVDHTHEDVG
jgi:hypothetical protein